VQKALDAVHGVDLNPFAVAIARFRLMVAALQASGLTSLEQAPAFTFHLAAGDSLLHGGHQLTMDFDGFDADSQISGFAYATEDLTTLKSDSKEIRDIRGKEIGLVFQEPMTSFSPVHTVGSQIIEAVLLHQKVSKKEARNRAIEQLRLVGIPKPERRVDEFAFELSGGMRQRAMIAMALSCDPTLLIADEPTTALDVTIQAQILDLLRQLQEQRGMAIMLITHNLGVVAEMSDDVVVMYLGRVVEQGAVDDIFHAPKHPYTNALLKSIPSIKSAPKIKLPTISGSIPHPFNRPPGCPFHPRCPEFMPGTCDQSEPEMAAVGERQRVSCFLYPLGGK
jgi:peptide/nickel transport system ATP-binding protein